MARHLSTCSLCEASCGITVDVVDGAVTAIRGDKDDPFSRGHICPKAVALQDVHTDPDRLRRPLVRDGDGHREIGWDEAFALAASKLEAIRGAHGKDALAFYVGNPIVHNFAAMMFTPLFAGSLGTKNKYSAASIDQLPQMVAALAMFGHQLLIPVPDVDRTDHLLIFGANPAASNGSLLTAPGLTERLDAIRARGGRVVLIDPRRTESTRHASEHHFVRPGMDALVMLAMAQTLFSEGLVRLGPAAAFTDGLAALEAAVARFTPERVAARAGMPADTIRRLARELAASARGAVYGRIGISTQAFGTLASWLVQVLNIITGHLDIVGGVLFPTPAIDVLRVSRFYGPGSYDSYRSRVRGLPEFGGELPISTLVDEMETPGAGQVRGLVTLAGNPVLSTPDGRRFERALGKLDFYLAIDSYLNESTRHADLILPPASPLERGHYDLALFHFSVRNFVKYTPAVFARPADGREDWEILATLAQALTRKRPLEHLAAKALARLGPRRALDLALRTGPRGAWPFARRGRGGLSLAALEAAPHGIDLGPLEPTLPERLQTRGKRLQIAPRFIVDDLPRLERELASAPEIGELELIGRRHLRSNNSWLHNSHRLVKGADRCTLMMHPDDASTRGLMHGQRVRVASTSARVVHVALEVTDQIMPGVVSLPHGYGHTGRVRLSVAGERPGVSANDLTDAARLDVLSGNAAFSGTRVIVDAREESA